MVSCIQIHHLTHLSNYCVLYHSFSLQVQIYHERAIVLYRVKLDVVACVLYSFDCFPDFLQKFGIIIYIDENRIKINFIFLFLISLKAYLFRKSHCNKTWHGVL